MRIEPGYYKIRRKGYYLEGRYHYLRVYVKNRKKFLLMDNEEPTEAEKCEQDIIQEYEIVKRLTPGNPIEVHRAEIALTWQDEDGDSYRMPARNIHVFFKILKLFPRVAKALDLDPDRWEKGKTD